VTDHVVEDLMADREVAASGIRSGTLRQIDIVWLYPETGAVPFTAPKSGLGNGKPPHPLKVAIEAGALLDLLPCRPIDGRRVESVGADRNVEWV